MEKVLMLASVASMIQQFNMSNIELLQKMGLGVDVACNFEYGNTCSKEKIAELKHRLDEIGVGYFQVDFTRNVLNLKQDYIALKQVNQLLKENEYVFLHCHSPIGGVVGRIAGHRNGCRVLYTAHGFHFYKGASKLNWLLFYPIEKYLSRYTDTLITMNQEDYQRAKEKFHAGKTEIIPGVGIVTDSFGICSDKTEHMQEELSIPKQAKVLLSVGELNQNKNHAVVLRALKELNDSGYHYLICGQGQEKEHLERLAEELGVREQLHLLGFRADVGEVYAAADIFLFPSRREGLSVALMEAMASGLPSVVSNIRGNKDLIRDGENGFLVPVEDEKAYAAKISYLTSETEAAKKMGEKSREYVQAFDVSRVEEEMNRIYTEAILR